jgi:hypothetical protein
MPLPSINIGKASALGRLARYKALAPELLDFLQAVEAQGHSLSAGEEVDTQPLLASLGKLQSAAYADQKADLGAGLEGLRELVRMGL